MVERTEQQIHYTHRTSYTYQERLVGLYLLGALLLFLGLLFSADKTRKLLQGYIILYAQTKNSQDLVPDTEIQILGVKAGKITAVDFDPRRGVVLTLRIAERFHELLRQDSTATVSASSLFGAAVIAITPGSPASPQLADGATIAFHRGTSLQDVLANAAPVIARLEDAIDNLSAVALAFDARQVKILMDNFGALAGDLRNIGDRIHAGEGALGALLQDPELERQARSLVQSSVGLMANLDQLSFDLAAGKGIIGAALSDPALRRDFARAVAVLDDTLVTVRARLVDLRPLLANAEIVERDLRQILADFKISVREVNVLLSTLNTELKHLPGAGAQVKILLDDAERTLDGIQQIWPISKAVKTREKRQIIEVQPINE